MCCGVCGLWGRRGGGRDVRKGRVGIDWFGGGGFWWGFERGV